MATKSNALDVAMTNNQGEEKDDNKQEENNNLLEAESSLLSNYVLPKPHPPPAKEFEKVQEFVAKTIQQREEEGAGRSSSNSGGPTSSQRYGMLVDTIRNPQRQQKREMVGHILLALQSAASGTLLHTITTSKTHARLMHFIIRFNPLDPAMLVTTTTKKEDATNDNNDDDGDKMDDNGKVKDENKEAKEKAQGKAKNHQVTVQILFQVADSWFHLLAAIVSSNSVYIVPSLTAVWKLLAAGGSSNVTFPFAVTGRLHAALATLLRLCPKGKMELFPIIASNRPFAEAKSEKEVTWYYQQALHVLCYLPAMRNQILELLIDQCLAVDVQIKVNDGGHATIENDDDENDNKDKPASMMGEVFEFDCGVVGSNDKKQKQAADDDDDDDNKSTKSTKSAKSWKSNLQSSTGSACTEMMMLKEAENQRLELMANKLDSLMYLLFEFLESSSSSSSQQQQSQQTFAILLSVFSSSILITHKSKFVQFVIFYVCGLQQQQQQQHNDTNEDEDEDDAYYREFAARLIEVVMDHFRATTTRQTGACYLASFVSRGSFCTAETVCEAVSALLRYAEVYQDKIDRQEMSGVPGNASPLKAADVRQQSIVHSLYYTVCQAAFYIMCFRGVEAMEYYQTQQQAQDADLDQIDVSPERWQRVCCHALGPLNNCLESVKMEFLQLAEAHSLLNVQQIMAAEQSSSPARRSKKRRKSVPIRSPATLEKERRRGGVGGLGRGRNPLDSFFPFDPYLLRRSHVFVEPFYNHWNGNGNASTTSEGEESTVTAISVDSRDRSGGGDDDDDDDSRTIRSETDDGMDVSVSSATPRRTSHHASVLMHQTSSPMVETARTHKELQQQVWSQTLKRSRAPSIENGSW